MGCSESSKTVKLGDGLFRDPVADFQIKGEIRKRAATIRKLRME
jgi:hypothetical protein